MADAAHSHYAAEIGYGVVTTRARLGWSCAALEDERTAEGELLPKGRVAMLSSPPSAWRGPQQHQYVLLSPKPSTGHPFAWERHLLRVRPAEWAPSGGPLFPNSRRRCNSLCEKNRSAGRPARTR